MEGVSARTRRVTHGCARALILLVRSNQDEATTHPKMEDSVNLHLLLQEDPPVTAHGKEQGRRTQRLSELLLCVPCDRIRGTRMRDFPSCFGESGVQVSKESSSGAGKTAQNLVTCLYQAQLLGRRRVINVTWSKNLMGQGLSVGIDDLGNQCPPCRVEIKPPWLFSKRKGSRTLDMEGSKIDIFWDLSAAKFGPGPAPLEGFYVALVFDHQMVLLLGNLIKEAYQRTNARRPPSTAVFVAKTEHIYGKKLYSTKAQFCDDGQFHDVAIECDTVGLNDPCLEICIDKKRVMQIKRLAWKFRGNQTILVDGLPVEVFWDVHSWLFGSPTGNAVFMFQTCLSAEKLLSWSTTSQVLREPHLQGLGFSLILHAWKIE
ncbi:hypothetical protein B296_00054095 [Ensete ventricosum]|uniref:DUF868 domain-containing protein n=1 Tax=Ensete ventricosum TaxID=4639 RepID=A0A426XHE8_ENSVE|nr:hypothetical protein B296_00054095 [Ensete ventricosum]